MNDFYCNQILNGKVDVSVVFETDRVLAFHHTQPYFEHHIVIIPKQHIESLALESIEPELAIDFLKAIQRVTSMLEKVTGGCRVSSNVGNYQTTKHLHWYVHSGNRLRNEDGSPIKT
jgi:histidine triad (HIT) family protein